MVGGTDEGALRSRYAYLRMPGVQLHLILGAVWRGLGRSRQRFHSSGNANRTRITSSKVAGILGRNGRYLASPTNMTVLEDSI